MSDDVPPAVLPPEQAFAVLGNETRVRILQVLGEADDPLSFTELRTAVGLRQGTQFNYHLTKLVGHFVAKTEAGYRLRQPGHRIVQAILSGAVAEGPAHPPERVDFPCLYCGTDITVAYHEGLVLLDCPGCHGVGWKAGTPTETTDEDPVPPRGNLGNFGFPPAGAEGRTGLTLLRAAGTWAHLKGIAVAGGVCPRCAGRLDKRVVACDSHEAETDVCDACGKRLAILLRATCHHCTFEAFHPLVMGVLDVPAVLSFVGDHDLNTTSMGIDWGWDCEERILDTDPFRGAVTYVIDDEALTLTVDESGTVLDAVRAPVE